MPVLEYPGHRAEGGSQRQHVAHQGLQRQHRAAGEQEQQRKGDAGDQYQHQRKLFGDCVDAVTVDLGKPGHFH